MSSNQTPRELAGDLKTLGVVRGDVLLVHSSLKSLGPMERGADTIIDALLTAVGSRGTVMMPTFTGSAALSKDNPPVFDVRNSAGWTGFIPETFRRRPGVRRSLHPTHSVAALGPAAEFLIQDHEICNTPCGWESPFGRLIRLNGKVLFLGCDLAANTLFHACEEFAGLEYHLQPDYVEATVIDENRKRRRTRIKIHWYNPDADRDYPSMERVLFRHKALTRGKVGAARSRLLLARPTYQITMTFLIRYPRRLLVNR